jgi:hypothetical protein
MFAPASFTDAASRYLETTGFPTRHRWDPSARTWRILNGDAWDAVPTEVMVTTVCRYLADDLEMNQLAQLPIPHVLTGVRHAASWTELRAKVNRASANNIVRLCSGAPAFHGIPSEASTTRDAPTDALTVWVSSALVSAPGVFIKRSTIVDAFLAAHAPGTATRRSVSEAIRSVLGEPSVREGLRGYRGITLAS